MLASRTVDLMKKVIADIVYGRKTTRIVFDRWIKAVDMGEIREQSKIRVQESNVNDENKCNENNGVENKLM